jgi:hypothetical protein
LSRQGQKNEPIKTEALGVPDKIAASGNPSARKSISSINSDKILSPPILVFRIGLLFEFSESLSPSNLNVRIDLSILTLPERQAASEHDHIHDTNSDNRDEPSLAEKRARRSKMTESNCREKS